MEPVLPDRRIRRIGGLMSVATLVVAAGLLAAAVYLAADERTLAQFLWATGAAATPDAVSTGTRLAVIGLGLPSLGLILWSLWNAFRLFRAYRRGAVLAEEIGRRVRRIGVALFALPFVAALTTTLTSIVVSLGLPPGSRRIVISFDSGSIVLAVAGALLILVGWSMTEAARVADENRQFV